MFVFKGSPWPDPRLLGASFVAVTGLAILGGLALGRGISRHPPLEILRNASYNVDLKLQPVTR